MATILQITNADRNLSHFCKAIKLSGLEDKLNEIGPFTLLVPVNLAFQQFDSSKTGDIFSDQNRDRLKGILSGHIIAGKNMHGYFVHGRKLTTIDGKQVTVTVLNGEIRINDAKVLAKDRQGRNGVVHSVDSIYSTS
jgi:uncharacterized surface protein with fasciclin (FAS1) repeats